MSAFRNYILFKGNIHRKKYAGFSITGNFHLAIFAVYGTEKIITVCADKDFRQCAGVSNKHAGAMEIIF